MPDTTIARTPRRRAAPARIPIETSPEIIELFRSIQAKTPLRVVPGKKRKKVKELHPDLARAIEAFSAAKATAKYAREEKKRWEAIIRAELGDAEIGTIDGQPVVKKIHSHSSHCDMEILETAYPEAFEASHKTKDYDYLQEVK